MPGRTDSDRSRFEPATTQRLRGASFTVNLCHVPKDFLQAHDGRAADNLQAANQVGRMQPQHCLIVVSPIAAEQRKRERHGIGRAAANSVNHFVDQPRGLQPFGGRALAAEIVILVRIGAVSEHDVVDIASGKSPFKVRELHFQRVQIIGVIAIGIDVAARRDRLIQVADEGP